MRIALIAMSGVRACDPKLLELGLTLPGFVERSRTIASLPSLGLLTLAGMTPPQHEVHYIEVADLKAMPRLPRDLELVAISSFSAQVPEAYELGRRLAESGVPVVIGGLHVTTMPDEPRAHGCSAAVGEGELTWPRILHDAQRGMLQPLYRSQPAEFDLADAPMPRFDLLDISRYNRLTVQTSRGCPWRCAFCASSILLTRRYKQKPVAKVLAEIDMIRTLWRRPFIEFADDNAFVNRDYWRALLPELKRRRIKWFAETDLSVAQDEDLLRQMRDAGCAQVLIGFESPTAEQLDGVELRRNWKRSKWPLYHDTVRRIQHAGIRVNACFVLGLDGHTPATFDAVERFVTETAPYDVQVTYQTPFPGTPLYQQLRAAGRLTHDGQWERCTLFDINYQPSPMTVDELRDGFYGLVQRLYSAEATRWRRDEFARMARGAAAAA